MRMTLKNFVSYKKFYKFCKKFLPFRGHKGYSMCFIADKVSN